MDYLGVAASVAYGLAIVLIVVRICWKVFTRRGRATIGPSAAGAYYGMLSQDRREAAHIVIEKLAEKQDPEDKDGNLPDLAGGSMKRPRPRK